MNEWIDVKDSLPEKGEDVIVSDGHDKWIGSYRWHSETEGSWSVIMHGPFRSADVKYWMSFPEINSLKTK